MIGATVSKSRQFFKALELKAADICHRWNR